MPPEPWAENGMENIAETRLMSEWEMNNSRNKYIKHHETVGIAIFEKRFFKESTVLYFTGRRSAPETIKNNPIHGMHKRLFKPKNVAFGLVPLGA